MTTTVVHEQMCLSGYQIEDIFIEGLKFSLGLKYLGLSIEYTAVSWKTNQMTLTLYY